MDEMKFSMDGSDRLTGGRPENLITLLGVARSGTTMNNSSMSSTLMFGSNAAGEALPVHVMFSSDAQEENYQVDARFLANFPRVVARFGNEEDQEFCAKVTVNEKSVSDSRVLHQAITCYTQRLYPDASDLPGHRVSYKIDGARGRLDGHMLAAQCAHGAYLFPGVQNTTHVTQKTDQYYGLFKSDVIRNIHILTSDLVTDFNRRQALFDLDRENNRPPPKTVSISRMHYCIILSGCEAYPPRGISALAPELHYAFSKTKNLRAWDICGTVPLTQSALNHRSVRGEVARNATSV
jgi:hypothetical protein